MGVAEILGDVEAIAQTVTGLAVTSLLACDGDPTWAIAELERAAEDRDSLDPEDIDIVRVAQRAINEAALEQGR